MNNSQELVQKQKINLIQFIQSNIEINHSKEKIYHKIISRTDRYIYYK